MVTVLKCIRGLVRPILTFAIIGIIACLVLKFAAPHIEGETAKALIYFFTGAGTTVMAYWFGERKKS